MDIYFCEKCGKRLTSDNIARGEAKNKKLRGVFCTDCSEGVMTMEMLPLTDDAAKALLSRPAPKPAAPVEPSRDPKPRQPAVQKSASTMLPYAAAAGGGLVLAVVVLLLVGGKKAPPPVRSAEPAPKAQPPLPTPVPVPATTAPQPPSPVPIVSTPPVQSVEPAPAETPVPQTKPVEPEPPPATVSLTPPPEPEQPVDDVPEEPEPKAVGEQPGAKTTEPPPPQPAATVAAPGEQIVVLRQGQPVPELKLASYTKMSDVNLYSWRAHADTVQQPMDFLKVSGSAPALIQFKVFAHEGGPLPDNTEILEAKLILHKENHYAAFLALDALAENWDPLSATFNSAAKGRPWKTPGGSTRPQMVASVWQKRSVSKPTPHLAHAFDVTAYLREAQKSRTNFGWRLQAYETDERKGSAKGTPGPQIVSSRHAKAEMRPALELKLKAPKSKD